MIPNPDLLRILDAGANRAREALRVLEDHARFALNDSTLTKDLKHLRHALAAALNHLPMDAALLTRDTLNDVGTAIKTPAEFSRESPVHILTANAKRLSEALRSLEETAKVLNPVAAASLEKIRYQGYTVEKQLMIAMRFTTAQDRFRAIRLYVLLTESLCNTGVPPASDAGGGATWQNTLDAILAIPGPSPLAIQLREKNLPDAELLRRAKILVDKCRRAGALAIINDRPDIALLSQADGIHLGQTDLPCDAARQLLGPEAIIGVSTEYLDQARNAQAAATYIAVGPMFPTTTKNKPRIAGPAYAAEVLAALPGVPIVAIGGITPENLPQITATGIQTVAVSSAILQSQDPAAAVTLFQTLLHNPTK